MISRRAPRLLARFSPGERWFPDDVIDVVAHGDGRLISVTVTRRRAGEPQVLIRGFEAAPATECLREICRWLRSIEAAAERSPDAVLDWAADLAKRIVDAVYGA